MKRWIILLAVLSTLAAACTAQTTPPEAGTVGPTGTTGTAGGTLGTRGSGPVGLFAAALEQFDSCDAFLEHVKAEAIERVGPYGLEGGFYGGRVAFAEEAAVGADDGAGRSGFDPAAPATTVAADLQQGVDYSGTNVQELGIDEPDIVKTDGRRIFAVAQGSLLHFEVIDGQPVLRGKVFLGNGWNHQLLLAGDSLFVMATTSRWDMPQPLQQGVFAPDYGGSEIATLTKIDVSDPDQPRVVRRMFVDGRVVSARMHGDTIRIVLASNPTGLEFLYPAGSGLRGEQRAIEVNRDVIRESTIENWIPYYILEDGSGRVLDEGNLVQCENAYYPSEFSGFTMLSVMTLGMDGDFDPAATVGVLSGGDTVYASQDSLYVASQRWIPWETLDEVGARQAAESVVTHIHKFDLGERTTDYAATGTIDGFLLNQFSMSERDGYLRVAATNRPTWFWWGDANRSESSVIVLEQDGAELVEVGRVDGLGRGEQIFAVRFLDDAAYVVTFRQVDPLYTIDLADPTNPRAVGELKIPGFSSYLHPVGDGLLLGIGQDATAEGFTQGTQVSLFDVSDLASPQRLAQWTMPTDDNGASNSEVEYDHRAFLYWPATGTAVLPINRWSWDEETQTEDNFFGAVVIKVAEDGITEVGRITHDRHQGEDGYYDWGAQIRRSIVIQDALYTLSDVGLMASDLDTLATKGVVYFDQAESIYPEDGGTDTTLGG